jgi:hypothetical protein
MTTEMREKLWHKRLTDFEPFDKITFEIVPRYKESGLSGDEWRQHVEVTFWFKGHEVHSFGCRNMESASMMLGHHLINAACPIPDKVIDVEKDMCDQPSCVQPPVYRYILKEEFSRSGEKLDSKNGCGRHYRQFCERHRKRGDCGREDSDQNYIKQQL